MLSDVLFLVVHLVSVTNPGHIADSIARQYNAIKKLLGLMYFLRKINILFFDLSHLVLLLRDCHHGKISLCFRPNQTEFEGLGGEELFHGAGWRTC